MASGDPFTAAVLPTDGTFIVDGSRSETGAAIVSGIAGKRDAEIYLDIADGSGNFLDVAQLTDENGDTTFTGPWHTQFNRIVVNVGDSPSKGDQRIRVENITNISGTFSADGVER